MKDPLKTGFSDRLSAQAEAKKAMLAKFKPKPTVQPEEFEGREVAREREREAIRAQRALEKEQARIAAEARRLAELESKRGERKQRKATTKAEQRAAREAKAASRRNGIRTPSSF